MYSDQDPNVNITPSDQTESRSRLICFRDYLAVSLKLGGNGVYRSAVYDRGLLRLFDDILTGKAEAANAKHLVAIAVHALIRWPLNEIDRWVLVAIGGYLDEACQPRDTTSTSGMFIGRMMRGPATMEECLNLLDDLYV